MKRNEAGQVIGVQMVSTEGGAFTGAVTVYVTVDGGTQAQGATGAGACTHKGNGFHTYEPTADETNGAHVALTFTGTGAVPATVQVYSSFPQTADAPSAVAIATMIAAALDDAVSSGGSGGGIDAAGVRAAVGLASNNLDEQLAGINAKTTNLPDDPAATGDIPIADITAIKTQTDKLADGIALGDTQKVDLKVSFAAAT
jgi:hypothetical protein